MSDLEFARRLGVMYNEVLSLRKDDDYAVNQPQMDKFLEVMRFFLDCEKEMTGKVDPVKLSPKEIHGDVTARFLVFDLFNDSVQRFCSVMSACTAITIDVVEGDKVCISCTVPNVFIQKSQI